MYVFLSVARSSVCISYFLSLPVRYLFRSFVMYVVRSFFISFVRY